MDKHTVVFQPMGVKTEVTTGTSLLEAANEAGIYVNSLCGGEGVCGKVYLERLLFWQPCECFLIVLVYHLLIWKISLWQAVLVTT